MLPIRDYFRSTVKEIRYISDKELDLFFDYCSLLKIQQEEKSEDILERIKCISKQLVQSGSMKDNDALICVLQQLHEGRLPDDEIKREQAETIWNLFLCYRVIVWEDSLSEDEKNRLKLYSESDNENDLCWTYSGFVSLNYLDENIKVAVFVDSKRKKVRERILVRDLFTGLIYQLIMHISSGVAGRDGYSICNCKQCGKQFMRDSAKTKFCIDCRSEAARAKRYREKRKGANV